MRRVAVLIACIGLFIGCAPRPAPAARQPAFTRAKGVENSHATLYALFSTTAMSLPGNARRFAERTSAPSALSPSHLAGLERILRETHDQQTLFGTVAEFVQQRFDAKTFLPDVDAWTKSQVAVRIFSARTAAVAAQGSDQARNEARSFFDRLSTEPPAARRMDLVRRLDEASREADLTVQVTLAVLRLGDEVAGALGPPAPGAPALLDQATREHVERTIREQAPLTLLYALRDLTDADLTEAVEFWESPAGKWYAETLSKAVDASLTRAREDAVLRASRLAATP